MYGKDFIIVRKTYGLFHVCARYEDRTETFYSTRDVLDACLFVVELGHVNAGHDGATTAYEPLTVPSPARD